MKKLPLYPALLLLAALCLCFFFPRLPPRPVHLPPQRITGSVLLLPLDSRPVCSTMVQQLGRLAGLNVIVPPKELLDNYRRPADRQKLLAWLQREAPRHPYSIISADLLLHGGLLQSRQAAASPAEQSGLVYGLQQLAQGLEPQQGQLAVFSVIPRLLVSDELYPDRWYQFHLMRYSQLLDMTEINNDPFFTALLLEYKKQIPPAILNKYLRLYEQSQNFHELLLASRKQAAFTLVIGQDDSSPLGLPHRSARQLEQLMEEQQSEDAFLSYGADELAALLLARYYLQQTGWQPRVFLRYASPSAEFKYMPYMAVSVGTALRSQLQLLGARQVNDMAEADIICYIHCGDENTRPATAQAEELTALLQSGRHVALIDLSANFAADELLLPLLLQENVPLNRLTAYAGWNTFSNSSGTALAQACILTGRLRSLPPDDAEQLLSLYAANLNFTAERLLEDYYYQKLLHPQLRPGLESLGITPVNLDEEEKRRTELYLQKRLSFYAWQLWRQNLGKTPFLVLDGDAYFLRDLTAGVQLPWNRIFEVDLTVAAPIGAARHKNTL